MPDSPAPPAALLVLGPLFLGLLGLLIGSFLNVVIARVPHGQSIVHPRSRCPRCGHTLSWYENIPVFSWLALRGRCRACRAPISWRYPAVELLTALLFLACLQRFGWTAALVSALVLVSLLVPLTFIDLEHWVLPFSLTLPGIAAGVLLAFPQGLEALRDAVLGAAGGFLAFWALEWLGAKLFKKEALGGGDKYLLALLGAFLSWRALLGIVFLSSLQGALVGSLLLLVRGRAGPAPAEEGPPGLGGAPPGEPGVGAEGEGRPDDAGVGEVDDWIPGPTNIPFGPWLSLAALELLLLGPWLARVAPYPLGDLLGATALPGGR